MSFRRQDREAGQALVEFSIVIIVFLGLLMSIADLGRGIYMYNGVAQASREIARTTSVHPWDTCCDLGSSGKAQSTVAVQRGLVPALTITTSTDIVCVDISDAVKPDNQCRSGDWIRVRTRAPFAPITPVVQAFGSMTLESYARVQIP